LHALDHNDFMYATAATRGGDLYQDLHFVQAPLSYMFVRLVAVAAPTDLTFLSLRLSSVGLTLGAIFVLVTAGLRTHLGQTVTLLLASTNVFVLSAASEIGSYALPLLLVTTGAALVLSCDDFERPSRWHDFAAGLCIGLATSAKLTHGLFVLPLVAAVASRRPMNAGTAVGALVPVVAGCVAGGLPLAFYLLRDPDAFITHNVLFHSQFTYSYRELTAWRSATSVLSGFLRWLISGGLTVLALVTWHALRQSRPTGSIGPSASRSGGPELSWIAFWLTSLGVGALPGVGGPQYLAPLGLFSALLMGRLIERRAQVGGAVGRLLPAVLVALAGQQVMTNAGEWWRAARYESAVHEVSEVNRRIGKLLTTQLASSCPIRVFSYSGAFLVGGTQPLASFTETGIFWARLRGHVPERWFGQRPGQIPRELVYPEEGIGNRSGPTVVVTGFYALREPEVEQALIQMLKDKRFVIAESINSWLVDVPLTVWFHPDCQGGTRLAHEAPLTNHRRSYRDFALRRISSPRLTRSGLNEWRSESSMMTSRDTP
jgi:hypothetical protein